MVGLSTYPCYLSVDRQWISFAMIDEADAEFGKEVTVIWDESVGGTKARIVLYKREEREAPYFVIADHLTELNRLGQKTGAGFYNYGEDGHTAITSPEIDDIISDLAEKYGIDHSAADIDVVWTSGYGFPGHLGGPMFSLIPLA